MREIEWIKEAVGACIVSGLPDDERSAGFLALEKQYEMFSAEEKAAIRNILKSEFAVNDRIYVYSIFLRYMAVKEFAEDMLEAAGKSDLAPCTGAMLELQTYKYGKHFKGYYKKVKEFHKKNIENFDSALHVNFPYRELKQRNQRRIVIVTEQILSILHAPTKVVLNIAYALNKLGYEVLLFVCPCDRGIPEELWYEPTIMNSDPEFKNIPMRVNYRGVVFEGYQINMTSECLKEYHMMFQLIHAWNPLFVFDLGTANPVVDLVQKFTTLVAWEMSLVCPVSIGSILVRLGRMEEELERDYEEALEEYQTQLFMDESFPVLVEETGQTYTRSEIGLPENRFLIAIVGNRLDTDINEAFVDVMGELLKRLPDMDFVIIGSVAEEAWVQGKFASELFRNRMHFLGYRRDLPEVLGVLDLYLNPERGGGGFSSAIALVAGIPVVTLPDCDVAYNAGEEFVVSDYEEMLDIVVRYRQDKAFYEEKTAAAWRYKEQNTDAKLERYVKKMLSDVMELIYKQEDL